MTYLVKCFSQYKNGNAPFEFVYDRLFPTLAEAEAFEFEADSGIDGDTRYCYQICERQLWRAWHSEGQKELAGSSFYLTEDGEEIEITEVKPSDEPSFWEDAVKVGNVVKWVRCGEKGSLWEKYEDLRGFRPPYRYID